MAFTNTIVKQTVFGNQRVLQYNVTTDAASGVVATGLNYIDCAFIGPISMATASPKMRINTNGTSGAANGSVFLSSTASGDNFFLIIYGR